MAVCRLTLAGDGTMAGWLPPHPGTMAALSLWSALVGRRENSPTSRLAARPRVCTVILSGAARSLTGGVYPGPSHLKLSGASLS